MPPLPNYGNGSLAVAMSSSMPPPSPPSDRTPPRSSSTLFEMMSHEQVEQQQQQQPRTHFVAPPMRSLSSTTQQQLQQQPAPTPPTMHDRVSALLSQSPPVGLSAELLFNDAATADVRLTLSSPTYSAAVRLHARVLAANSRYFAAKLQHNGGGAAKPLASLTEHCDDAELYLLTLRLMYTRDKSRALLPETVTRVLAMLKVAWSIVFEAAIVACLEYLEAVPWAEEEEDAVRCAVSQLQSEFPTACAGVLSRLLDSDAAITATGAANAAGNASGEAAVLCLVRTLLSATSERGRRELKPMLLSLLRRNAAAGVADCGAAPLLSAAAAAADALAESLAAHAEGRADVSRGVDGLLWLCDVLIERGLGGDVAALWAEDRAGVGERHAAAPAALRHEVSRVTARLCAAIGCRQLAAPPHVRRRLLRAWLPRLMDDFCWLQRGGAAWLDKKAVEEGLCHTILTLPADEQRHILMDWFVRFSRDGDNCPNLQRAFQVWWRRAFSCKPAKQQPLLLPAAAK